MHQCLLWSPGHHHGSDLTYADGIGCRGVNFSNWYAIISLTFSRLAQDFRVVPCRQPCYQLKVIQFQTVSWPLPGYSLPRRGHCLARPLVHYVDVGAGVTMKSATGVPDELPTSINLLKLL
jgi:hypothetical protein